jgi:16S rRNA (guanine527-N7)-methyltransferase
LTQSQERLLGIYASHLLAENKRAGLTSAGTDREAIYRRHFTESLALLAAIETRSLLSSPVIDIGSGGGFPGLVIAVVRPETAMTLLEANQKKAAFLESMARELGLANVRVVCARAEDAGRNPGEREGYLLALARAVAPLRVLVEYALPFVRVGGVLAAPKGSSAPRELREAANALAEMGGEIEHTGPRVMPPEAERPPPLIIVRKTAPTPDRYPRRAGIPAKRPL